MIGKALPGSAVEADSTVAFKWEVNTFLMVKKTKTHLTLSAKQSSYV